MSASREEGGSSYRRKASLNASDEPLTVRLEFVVIDGPEGRALQQHQADVMRKVLEWIAEHRTPEIQ